MRDPANKPVKLRQIMSHHMLFAHPCKREPNAEIMRKEAPTQDPNRDKRRKGFRTDHY